MANGTVHKTNDQFLHALILDAQATTQTVAVYVDLGEHRRDVGIHIKGINGDTVQVWGDSVSTSLPTAQTNATQIGSNITADTHLALSSPPRFVGVMVSNRSSGTVSVGLTASR